MCKNKLMSSETRVNCGNCGKALYLINPELNKCGTCNHYNKMLPDGNTLTYKDNGSEGLEADAEEEDVTKDLSLRTKALILGGLLLANHIANKIKQRR